MGRVMGLSLISMIMFVFIMVLFPFLFVVCVYPMMLLYKDNYPYVVIEIYFHFMFVFWGSMIISGILCSFIFHISCDKDYLVYYDYLFLCVVWGYGHIIWDP